MAEHSCSAGELIDAIQDSTAKSSAIVESKKLRKRLERLEAKKKRKAQRLSDRQANLCIPRVQPATPDEAKRQKRALNRDAKNASFVSACARGVTLVVDCDFVELMKDTELNSLGQQLMFCYGANRRAIKPATLWFVGIEHQGVLHRHLLNVSGFERWLGTACDPRKLEALICDQPAFAARVVYLTADATEELRELDAAKVYVVGGLVDRNRHKGTTAAKAERLGVATARLPIGPGKPLVIANYSFVLSVNQVVDVLLRVHSTGSWAAASGALPRRKSPALG